MTQGSVLEQRESILVRGAWTAPKSSRGLAVENPATGRTLAEIGYGDGRDALSAVDAAAEAFPSWSATTARHRADLLLKVYESLLQDASRIGLLLARETGKRLPEAVAEVRFAAEYFRWFAEQARQPTGKVIPHEASDRRHLTTASAAGVAVCLTPWNFPVSIQARKVAPALAAGCTVVSRPSEKAPLAVIEMFKAIQRAGFPPGVANLVHGPAAELTAAMLSHKAVRVVSFTGSTEVGRSIMRLAADRMIRPLLELGGDAPFIVFEDSDLGRAIDGAMLAKFRNNGQSCISANRFLVHEAVYEEFCRRFSERIDQMTVSDPCDEPAPDLGPVIDQARKEAIQNLVSGAVAAGGRVLTRQRPLPDQGWFVAPALCVDVPPEAEMSHQEIFGPIATVAPFKDEQAVIDRANASDMGLAAYVYTSSIDRGWRISEALQVGIVGLNQALPSVAFAPMGGVKQSGLGREGSDLGMHEFMDVKYVATGI